MVLSLGDMSSLEDLYQSKILEFARMARDVSLLTDPNVSFTSKNPVCGDEVTIDFDPMLAKLIVHAPTREAALRRLDTALSEFVVLGVTTNVGFLREVSKSEAFSNGLVTTDYLDNISLEEFKEPEISDSILISIAAGASRFGLDRNLLSVNSEIIDEYSGHSGDPFKTLTRSYP